MDRLLSKVPNFKAIGQNMHSLGSFTTPHARFNYVHPDVLGL